MGPKGATPRLSGQRRGTRASAPEQPRWPSPYRCSSATTPPPERAAGAPASRSQARDGQPPRAAARAAAAVARRGGCRRRRSAIESMARVMPIRVPTTISGSGRSGGGGPSEIGPPISGVALRSRPMPSACVSFPDPSRGPSHARSRGAYASPPGR